MTEVLHSSSAREMPAEVLLPPEWLCSLGFSDVPPGALAYCLRHGLRQYLLIAIDLVRQYFSGVEDMHLWLEQDPETAEEWLVLDVTLQQDVEEMLASCDAYTDRWIAQVPWPEREKIRFVYAMM